MNGRLPYTVRWRSGKQHLGWDFTQVVIKNRMEQIKIDIDDNKLLFENYLDMDKFHWYHQEYSKKKDIPAALFVHEAANLALWLKHHNSRPSI